MIHLFALVCNTKGFAIVIYFVTQKTRAQDLTHPLDTLKIVFVKIAPQFVIRDACGRWHGLFRVTSICDI